MSTAPGAALLASLAPDLYLAADAVGDSYSCDWTLLTPQRPGVVFRPRCTDEVAKILTLCHQHNQALVIQGGRSGLAGGATPQAGELSLSLEKMNQIVELDPEGMTITVGAGTPLQNIQEAASKHGLEFPMDLGARGSCQAGGIVATNAGGNQVIQHGMTRALVLGLTAVLADGTIVAAENSLLKNNAGYDLKQWFIGTEGTLGVVTQVTFRLRQAKAAKASALCACSSFDQVTALLALCDKQLPVVCAFEVMWQDYLSAALTITGSPAPFSPPARYSVLVQTEGSTESQLKDAFEACLGGALEQGLIGDAVLASSLADNARLWALRDAIAELLPTLKHAVTFDVGIPVKHMGALSDSIESDLRQELDNCQCLMFGHIGDGNLHIVAGSGRAEDKPRIEQIVYRRTQSVGGSISAEHGIGMLKKHWLGHSRSETEIALMRTLKHTLDPKGILNPGRVFDAEITP